MLNILASTTFPFHHTTTSTEKPVKQSLATSHSLLSPTLLYRLPLLTPSSRSLKMAEIRRKLVIVGDGACGKTCLLM
jgi:hypothetical protein